MSKTEIITFWLVATVASAGYSWKAFELFTGNARPSGAQLLHQRWLNFLGSMIGGLAAYNLYGRFSPCFDFSCQVEPTLWDLGGAVVAFIGVTGHAPYVAIGLVGGLASLGGRLAEILNALADRYVLPERRPLRQIVNLRRDR